MSEIQKPVADPVPAVAETAVVEPLKTEETAPAAATETPAVLESTTEPTAAVEETAAAPAVETPKKEFDGTGTLGYKAPGGFIKKLAGFQRKYFWLQDEPVHHKNLTNYLRGEKPEVGNHNAAWSSYTGKGLLYFSKHATEKATPAGVINLADVSDIKEDGTVDFSLLSHGQKHVFQATSSSEQTSWVSLLKAKVEEAKAAVEGIKESEEYKKEHSALSKPVPAVVAAVVPKPVEAKIEAKKEEKAEAKEEKKEEKVEKKEEKARKSRSASRKRNSIFGSFGFNKTEEKKAEVAEPTPAAEPAVAEAPAEVAAVEATPAVDAPAVEEPAKTETPVVAKEEARPAASKRNSIFGSFSKFGSKKEAKTEAPVVPAKDEPATTEAPVIPAVETTEPLATSVASPATVPTETTTITNGTTPATTEPEVKTESKPSEKRKSSLPFGLGAPKKDVGSESESEKPKSPSPFAKLRQTIKSKKSPKAPESKPEESKAEETPAAAEVAKKEEEEETPVVSEPISAAPASTPQVSATA